MTRSDVHRLSHTRLFVTIMITCFLLSAAISAPAQEAAGSSGIEGTVQETMDAAGYTYVNLSTDQGPRWIAIPQTDIAKGASLSFAPGMEMKDFRSNSLNRTFETIIFSPGLAGKKPASPHGTMASAKAQAADPFEAAVQAERQVAAPQAQINQASGGSQGAIAPFSEISVEKAEGDNSYTVGELFDKREELAGQKIRVRGQVVKFNANIMGRNWLHIQDGTGDPMHNTHDLVVTTSAEIDSPEVVVVEGTLIADKDFGAGYKYAVLIEEATIIQ